MEKKWYVVHTYSGYENKVKTNLEKRVQSMEMEDKIFRVLVPMIEEDEIGRDGKKKRVKKKIFPGYVLVEMLITDDSWYVVRNTPGVTGFVGSGTKPIPLDDQENKNIMRVMGIDEPKFRIDFVVGDTVQINEGPFEAFIGIVEEIMTDRQKVKVKVGMFGRDTPVELSFSQVKKM
ncbi:MAG: transcription termination/antitermination protein NusG [bacterium]|nr:transcription termination/antitermination protein NusG [bacterium]